MFSSFSKKIKISKKREQMFEKGTGIKSLSQHREFSVSRRLSDLKNSKEKRIRSRRGSDYLSTTKVMYQVKIYPYLHLGCKL